MGFSELVVVLLIVLVLFGATRLPALGKGVGGAIRGFKDAMKGEAKGEEKGEEKGDAKTPPPDEKKELPRDAGGQG